MANTTLSPLQRADGSAQYSSNGYSVIAAVNGPIEVQRRDELPEEAAVDVAVRPATGVGGKSKYTTPKDIYLLMCVQDYEKGILNLLFKKTSAMSSWSQHILGL